MKYIDYLKKKTSMCSSHDCRGFLLRLFGVVAHFAPLMISSCVFSHNAKCLGIWLLSFISLAGHIPSFPMENRLPTYFLVDLPRFQLCWWLEVEKAPRGLPQSTNTNGAIFVGLFWRLAISHTSVSISKSGDLYILCWFFSRKPMGFGICPKYWDFPKYCFLNRNGNLQPS